MTNNINITFLFITFYRYEERKGKLQDPSEYVKIESLCLTNGGKSEL